MLPLNGAAQDLRSIGQLARDGAPGLALKLLDDVQPEAGKNIQGWLFFERQRVGIMRDWNLWQPLLNRLEQFPESAPADLQRWAKVERVNALLAMEQGEQARSVLRELIWLTSATQSQQEFSLFRRLVIRSYLVDDRLADSRQAMIRYNQDYGNKGADWIKLQARVFLRTDKAADAERLFASSEELDAESHAIKLLAQLRSAKRAPASILGEARKRLQGKSVQAVDQARLWKVMAEAATQMGSHLTHTRALEHAAMLSSSLHNDALFEVRGDDLWQAYNAYAMHEGNSMQLLVGQDQKWLQDARKWSDKRPERSRAFLSVVMLQGSENRYIAQAIERFMESVMQMDEGELIFRTLFLNTKKFSDLESVPNAIRYFLVDDALSRNAIEAATELMSSLKVAPDDADAFEWGLRRARVLILGGKSKEGGASLEKIITTMPDENKDKVDRATQVVFDLQTVGLHDQALLLFDHLLKLSTDKKLRRELLYWKADSYKAMGNHVQASLFYLRSATLIDGKGYDPWGQTARFQAAEVLVDGGLFDDARRMYESLMKMTREPGRRAAIRYKLQELWLKKQ